jgi:hypothetical protein
VQTSRADVRESAGRVIGLDGARGGPPIDRLKVVLHMNDAQPVKLLRIAVLP